MAKYLVKFLPSHPKASSSGCVYEHVLIVEAALGHYLPQGAEVHHVDSNKHNNSKSNLVICQDHDYHMLLHARTRIVRAGGNPNTQAICSTCRQVKDRSEFHRFNRDRSGIQRSCRSCAGAVSSRRWKTHRESLNEQGRLRRAAQRAAKPTKPAKPWHDVQAVKSMRAAGMSQERIALALGTTQKTIWSALKSAS